MDSYIYFCVSILVICCGPLFIDAQPFPTGYGRGRMFGRGPGMYPGDYPQYGGTYPTGFRRHFSSGLSASLNAGSALYPSMYNDPSLDGSVLHPRGYRDPVIPVSSGLSIAPVAPVLPVVPVVRDERPNVVSDNSGRTSMNLNIHNENNNVHKQQGSGRVTVEQGRRRSGAGAINICASPCGPLGGCMFPTRCMPNPTCPTGYGCQ